MTFSHSRDKFAWIFVVFFFKREIETREGQQEGLLQSFQYTCHRRKSPSVDILHRNGGLQVRDRRTNLGDINRGSGLPGWWLIGGRSFRFGEEFALLRWIVIFQQIQTICYIRIAFSMLVCFL
jgi:hypothetical protein